MKRKLALLALVALVVSSGCLSLITGGEVPDERLDEPPERAYAWDSETDVHVTVSEKTSFQVVYNLSAKDFKEKGEFTLFRRDTLGTRTPLQIRSLRYQYENGTVINGSQFDERGGEVTQKREVLLIMPPAEGGKLAFTSDSTAKRFALPTYVDGSYTVVLPEDRRTEVPLFGRISPSPTEVTVVDDRTHIYWEDVETNSVVVQFYLQRDLEIFAVIAGVFSLVAIVGLAFYRQQLQALKEKREDLGLDMELEDDDREGPPPGMR